MRITGGRGAYWADEPSLGRAGGSKAGEQKIMMTGVKIGAATATVCAFLSAPAIAADAPTQQQSSAVMTEWYIANCGTDGVPAMLAYFVPSIIAGSDPALIERLRTEMREGIAKHYPDRPAACAYIRSLFVQSGQ